MNHFPISHHFPTPPSALLDDHIGGESCVDLQSFADVVSSPPVSETVSSDRQTKEGTLERQCNFAVDRLQRYIEDNQYPPLIPFLARTENLPSHMPWILKRYHTSDGRLILREEWLKHHESFLVHRENGRLILQLVHLDDDAAKLPLPLVDQTEPEEEEDVELGVVRVDDTREDHKLDTDIDVDILEQNNDIGNDISDDT